MPVTDPTRVPAAGAAPDPDEERPPLGSWSRLYALVLGELVLLVLLFTLFARAFR